MRYYKRILIWNNLYRIKKLTAFRNLVQQYFQSAEYDWVVDSRIEDAEAKRLRSEINMNIESISSIVESSGVNPVINWSPPPAIGGYTRNIHLIDNIFNLGDFRVSYDSVIDNLDRTIGVYKRDTIWSALRIINPLFYLDLLFSTIADLPFIAIEKMGFNRTRSESSIIGRLIKAIIYLLSVVASIVTILDVTVGLENAREWFENLTSKVFTP